MFKKIIFVTTVIVTLGACDIILPLINDQLNATELGQFLYNFNQKSPITTSFDDAIYEVETLTNFEPEVDEYRPLEIQPKASSGGYLLKSGVYTMTARSFCLRGYTHGPSRGDGHLYAPLKGKKSGLIQAILENYGEKSAIPQQDIQALLWGVIAGVDMNSLGERHTKTLNQLFSLEELLTFQGKDWLNGFTEQQIGQFKEMALKNLSPQVKGIINADNKIRNMIQQNKTFQELEKVAVLAGVAPPEDMIREVSKGRWSYHPDGYYIRFFPNGYKQTRVDVYVPFTGDIPQETGSTSVDSNSKTTKEVTYRPSTMTAVPANRSSQRIGIAPVPVPPCSNNASPNDEKIRSHWEAQAAEYLTANTSDDIKNQSITCAYADMYLKNPKKYKWVGLAAIVSGQIGIEEKEKRWKPNVTDLMRSLMDGNKAVFDDLYWQHLAFEKNGIAEIERLYCEGSMTKGEYSGWKKIADGNVWEGNRDLLLHEQRDILQSVLYDNHPFAWYFSDSWGGMLINWGNVLKSPVPNDDTVFPSGLNKSIGNFNHRWNWIESHILPEWEKFESNPSNQPILLKSLKEVCPSINQ